MGRQTDRQTGRQTDRQTGVETKTETKNESQNQNRSARIRAYLVGLYPLNVKVANFGGEKSGVLHGVHAVRKEEVELAVNWRAGCRCNSAGCWAVGKDTPRKKEK